MPTPSLTHKVLLTASGCALILPLALLPAQATDLRTPSQPEISSRLLQGAESGSILWNLRSSFVSYVGGHREIGDGARQVDGNYSFPVTSVESSPQKVTLKASGRLLFTGHCSDHQDYDSCKLNFEISDPTLVLDPAGQSYLEMTVRTRNYTSGQVEGPHRVKMATLQLEGASQNQEGQTVTWQNIATELTEEGAHAFSNFYDPGTALSPLAFSYQGQALELEQSPYTLGNSWDSKIDYSNTHRAFQLGPYLLTASATSRQGQEASLSLLNLDSMQPIQQLTIPTQSSLPVAADGKGARFFSYNPSQQTLETYSFSGGQLSLTSSQAFALPQGWQALALGYNPQGNLLALYAIESASGSARVLYAPADGSSQALTRQLPAAQDVALKIKQGAQAASLTSYYGEIYRSKGQTLEPLPDGSFLYAPATTIRDQAEEKLITGHLLHLKNSDQDPVSEVAAAQPVDGSVRDYAPRYVKTSPQGHVYQWNSYWNTYSQAQFLTYQDGVFTQRKAVDSVPQELDGASEIASIFWDGQRTVLLDSARGRVLWLDENYQLQEALSVPNMTKSARHDNAAAVAMGNGDLLIPTVLEDPETYDDNQVWTRLIKRQKQEQSLPAEPSPEPSNPAPSEPTPSPEPTEPAPSQPAQPTPSPEPSELAPSQPAPAPSESVKAKPSETAHPPVSQAPAPSQAPSSVPSQQVAPTQASPSQLARSGQEEQAKAPAQASANSPASQQGGSQEKQQAGQQLTVDQGQKPASQLAATGSSAGLFSLLAAASLATGLLLLALNRRKKQ